MSTITSRDAVEITWLMLHGLEIQEILEIVDCDGDDIRSFVRRVRRVRYVKEAGEDCPLYEPTREACEECLTNIDKPCPVD